MERFSVKGKNQRRLYFKETKRFGCVRFQEVVNAKALESRLNLIWIGTWKLRVNRPKYRRNEKTRKDHNFSHEPISLVGCLSKVVAKIMSLRLKVLHKVIDVRKFAFLEGRGLMDSVLVANEVLEEVKRRKRSCIFSMLTMRKCMTQLVGTSFITCYKCLALMSIGLVG